MENYLQLSLANINLPVLTARIEQHINQDDQATFLVHMPNTPPLSSWITQKITFSMTTQEKTQYFYFIITHIETLSQKESLYQISAATPVWLLKKRTQSRSFHNITSEALFKNILTEYAFSDDEINIATNTKENMIAYIEQSQCTDFDFFNRVIQKLNMIYYFRTNEKKLSITIENKRNFTNQTILAYPFIKNHGILENKHHVNHLNGENTMNCNISCLTPGTVFELTDHPHSERNHTYRVLASLHEWDESSSYFMDQFTEQKIRYQNKITVATTLDTGPLHQPYTSIMPYLTDGTINGLAEHSKLTEQGKYYIDQAKTYPIQHAQYFLGKHAGMHFPLKNQSSAMVAQLNGEADKPVILGALYQTQQQNLATSRNTDHHLLKTHQGHMLRMDDQETSSHFEYSTVSSENQWIMKNNASNNDIVLNSNTGKFFLKSLGGTAMNIGETSIINVSNNINMHAESFSMTTGADEISLESQENIQIKSQHETRINTIQNITTKTEGNFLNETKEAYKMICQGEIKLFIQDGGINIFSHDKNIVMVSSEGISLSVGGRKVELKSEETVFC